MLKQGAKLDMTFGSIFEVYEADKKQRVKESTWESKSHVIRTKILPYFENRKIAEIEAKDVIAWQNELMAYRDEKGKPYSADYLRTIHAQLARCVANYFYRKRYSEYSFYDELPNQEAYDIIIIRDKLRRLRKGYVKEGWTRDSEILVEELYEYLLDDYDTESLKSELQKLKETIEDSQYEKSFNMESYKRIVTTIHSSKGLQYKQVIINSENFIWRGTMNNPGVHYVAITRPEEKLLVLFKQKKDIYRYFVQTGSKYSNRWDTTAY